MESLCISYQIFVVIFSKRTVEEETIRTATELLKSGAHRKLLDFDNHLDNVKNDWRNPELSDLISRCT